MSGSNAARGKCPECGWTTRIRKDGMIRHHYREDREWIRGHIFHNRRPCEGSGLPPVVEK